MYMYLLSVFFEFSVFCIEFILFLFLGLRLIDLDLSVVIKFWK